MLYFGRRKGERRSGIEGRRYDKTQSRGTDRRSDTERRSSVSRRKDERYKVKDTVFAKTKGSVIKIGQILDISKGGLAFHYIDIGGRPKKSFKLDIIGRNNGFHSENLTLRTITDLVADKEFAFSSIPMRRRGGQFADLSQNQISQLEYFITHYTLGIV